MLFHSGSLSTHDPALNQIASAGWVEVAPADARTYRLEEGQTVVVKSRRGALEAKVKISRKQAKGIVYIPYHFASHPVNRLTSKELTATYVSLEKV
jgi:predicted molibdopterin-dependent oxidoreductase YjgC